MEKLKTKCSECEMVFSFSKADEGQEHKCPKCEKMIVLVPFPKDRKIMTVKPAVAVEYKRRESFVYASNLSVGSLKKKGLFSLDQKERFRIKRASAPSFALATSIASNEDELGDKELTQDIVEPLDQELVVVESKGELEDELTCVEQASEEQVSEEQANEEQVSVEQVSEEQVSEEQAGEEQALEEQTIEEFPGHVAGKNKASQESLTKKCSKCGRSVIKSTKRCAYCSYGVEHKTSDKKKVKTYRAKGSGNKDELSGIDFILAIFFTLISIIVSFVYIVQGRQKGFKLLFLTIFIKIATVLIGLPVFSVFDFLGQFF